jgi:hypothetical protein
VACTWGTADVNGTNGNNRSGRNACYFRSGPVDAFTHNFGRPASPYDNDVNDDPANDVLVDETVSAKGPVRNMDITRGGGPDLVLETLEDRIGDSGSCFEAAFGFEVRESDVSGVESLAGFGATIDDVVLEWCETSQVADGTTCPAPAAETPGEVHINFAFSPAQGSTFVHANYDPPCLATRHALYWRPCNEPEEWSGANCNIGASGTVEFELPPSGCYAWVIVGNDGFFEGSYGQDSDDVERPPYPEGCNLVQDLPRACD